MKEVDSAQTATLAATVGGFVLANYAPLLSALCAAVGIGYTLWKWRREIHKAAREDHPLD